MNQILTIADAMRKKALDVIDDLDLFGAWKSIGATVNLVGSLRTGLLINNRDIDCHIYTDPFSLADSFAAISRLAENRRIKTVNYANLLDAEDQCLEWHAVYEDQDGNNWKIDMIHILKGSTFDGYFEDVADRISKVLTPETRQAILEIKHAIPPEKKVMGILVYKAVIEGGIRDVDSFWKWKEQNPDEGIITWKP